MVGFLQSKCRGTIEICSLYLSSNSENHSDQVAKLAINALCLYEVRKMLLYNDKLLSQHNLVGCLEILRSLWATEI
jgi:hypothetical protein